MNVTLADLANLNAESFRFIYRFVMLIVLITCLIAAYKAKKAKKKDSVPDINEQDLADRWG